jgi:hypothetical protein
MQYIGEKIIVMASFGGEAKLKPIKFKWAQRVIVIKETTYMWTERVGATKVYHFSVTDGGASYELSFNTLSMLWTLEKAEASQ